MLLARCCCGCSTSALGTSLALVAYANLPVIITAMITAITVAAVAAAAVIIIVITNSSIR
jgi:hypothetical protein